MTEKRSDRMARRAPNIASVDGTIEAADAIAGKVFQEINRVNHAPAELVNENVVVSHLGCLLRLNEIDSQTALGATARFQIARSEFGKHRRLAYVLVPMIENPDSS
jgi:hypothetical protein